MRTITAIGLVALLCIGIGFILYLLSLNRQAKKQQSEVDPGKLRKWSDD